MRSARRRHASTEDHAIRLCLRGPAAIDATELPWHKSQRHTLHPDGTIELTLRLNNLIDIKYEILRWGDFAEVLEPLALRDAVRESLRAASARYAAAWESDRERAIRTAISHP